MKKIHLKRKIRLKKNINKINIVIYTIILILIVLVFLFKYINKRLSPIILNYAEMESKKLATIVISKSINNEIAEELTVENLFVITKSDDGEIKTIDFNPVLVNQLLLKSTTAVQTNLKYLEEGKIDKLELGENALINYDPDNLKEGIFYKIPAGVVFNNPILMNLGPKIPVRFSLIGNIIANITSHVTNYGINNALINVQMNLKINQKVIIPITSKDIEVEVNVPLAIKIVQGIVPEFYFNGFSKNSSTFSLPIE